MKAGVIWYLTFSSALFNFAVPLMPPAGTGLTVSPRWRNCVFE